MSGACIFSNPPVGFERDRRKRLMSTLGGGTHNQIRGRLLRRASFFPAHPNTYYKQHGSGTGEQQPILASSQSSDSSQALPSPPEEYGYGVQDPGCRGSFCSHITSHSRCHRPGISQQHNSLLAEGLHWEEQNLEMRSVPRVHRLQGGLLLRLLEGPNRQVIHRRALPRPLLSHLL